MTIELKKINDFYIKPIKKKESGTPKGSFLFKKLYPSILLLGKSGAGKTTVTVNIIPSIADKKLTSIHIYSDTANKDPVVLSLLNKKFNISFHNELILDELLDILNQENEEPLLNSKNEVIPKLIIIIDDFSLNSRAKIFSHLSRINRHYCCILIYSIHDAKDITPAMIQQLSYAIFFEGIPIERLEHLLNFMGNDPGVIKKLIEFYFEKIKNKNFLYISSESTRFNFNQLVKIL